MLIPNLKPKLIVILGPTASGKSELAIKLAKKFGGEIISADSRQVYKGMDIGTGKVPPDKIFNFQFSIFKQIRNSKFQIQKRPYLYKGIVHHLLDVASPKRKFTVAQYRKLVIEVIEKIFRKGKIPILCGGTGFYIQAVVDRIIIPKVPPDWRLRKKLEKKSVEELYKILKKLDPQRAKTIEKENPRRLIRAIEIVMKTKKPVPALKFQPLPYPVLMIGIKRPKEELKKLIEKRFFNWLKRGLIKEVKILKKMGLSWKRIEDFGIHYRVLAKYLQKEIDKKAMIENSIKEIQNYAKRQMTWFKRDNRIHWTKNFKETESLTKEFLRG